MSKVIASEIDAKCFVPIEEVADNHDLVQLVVREILLIRIEFSAEKSQ